MHRIKAVAPILLLALGVVTSPAHAKGKFITVSAIVTDGNVREIASQGTFHGGLLVSFTEVGVGGSEVTTYVITADATATYACINRGGNHPQASNKQGVAGPVTATATFTADAKGKVIGSIPVPPLGPGNFLCPPGQNMELADVSYTNVVIRDVTHDASANVPGTFTLTLVPLN